MKKVMYLVLVLSICLIMGIGLGHADCTIPDDVNNLAIDFCKEYNNAHLNVPFPKFKMVDINDDTVFWIKQLEWETTYDKVANDYYDYVKTDVSIDNFYIDKNGSYEIEISNYCEYHYHSAPDDVQSAYCLVFNLSVSRVKENLLIVKFDTDIEGSFSGEKKRIRECQNEGLSYSEAVTKTFDEKIENATSIYEQWVKMCKEAVIDDKAENDEPAPKISSIPYNKSFAVNYALTFGPKNKNGSDMVFKSVKRDCTNFVSQCIWAGYGGTNSNNLSDIAAMRILVDNKYRMTSTWWGLSRYSSSTYPATKFMRVIELYNYMTSNTSSGPKGTGYNNNKVWNQITVLPTLGDILQIHTFDDSGVGHYGHSVIVTKTNSPNLNSNAGLLDRIWVTQHQHSMKNRTLRNFIESNCYNNDLNTAKMRLLRPKQTSF